MTLTHFSAVKSSDASNKDVRVLALGYMWCSSPPRPAEDSHKKESTSLKGLRQQAVYLLLYFCSYSLSAVVWVWAERVRLQGLFSLSPRCRDTGGAAWQWTQMLFGHRRQSKTFTTTAMFLAEVAGVALTDVYKSVFLLPGLCVITLVDVVLGNVVYCDLVEWTVFVLACLSYSLYDVHLRYFAVFLNRHRWFNVEGQAPSYLWGPRVS